MVASPMARHPLDLTRRRFNPVFSIRFRTAHGFVMSGARGRLRLANPAGAAASGHMNPSRGHKVELTEGAIRVRKGNRTLTIRPTPPPPDAEDAPDFIIHLDDLEAWDAPDNETEIEVAELQVILHAVEAECERHGLSVEFE
jgi:Immunity protein 74